MKFSICDRDFESSEECANYILEYCFTEEMFDELLDEVYGEINVCGIDYSASECFKRVDPIAYKCAFVDYESEEAEDKRDDLIDSLDAMSAGEKIDCFRFDVVCIDDTEND